jgi:hypothetical protein
MHGSMSVTGGQRTGQGLWADDDRHDGAECSTDGPALYPGPPLSLAQRPYGCGTHGNGARTLLRLLLLVPDGAIVRRWRHESGMDRRPCQCVSQYFSIPPAPPAASDLTPGFSRRRRSFPRLSPPCLFFLCFALRLHASGVVSSGLLQGFEGV